MDPINPQYIYYHYYIFISYTYRCNRLLRLQNIYKYICHKKIKNKLVTALMVNYLGQFTTFNAGILISFGRTESNFFKEGIFQKLTSENSTKLLNYSFVRSLG